MRVASTAGFIASLMLSASALAAPATVYSGGDILTMKGPTPAYVEALVEKDGKILYVGKRSDALRAAGKDARQVNLAGATLMPGFIDAHGHLIYATHTMLDADLAGVRNIPELLARLKAHAAETPEGDRIVGMGYRAEQMAEKRHPTRAELDTVSATRWWHLQNQLLARGSDRAWKCWDRLRRQGRSDRRSLERVRRIRCRGMFRRIFRRNSISFHLTLRARYPYRVRFHRW